MLADDERTMVEWTVTGTHEGELSTTPPTGRDIDMTGMSKTLIEDGNVQEGRIYYNF